MCLLILSKMKKIFFFVRNDNKWAFEAARAFYKSSLEYALNKIAFHAIWINFFNRKEEK